MKRPVAFLSLFFLSIICSTVIVTTAVSSLVKSLDKEETQNSTSGPIESESLNEEVHNTSVKF